MGKDVFLGSWVKATSPPCSLTYPDRLVFHANGQYRGQRGPGDYSVWDVGTFEVVSDREVKISTANDAVRSYRYAISGDVLTIVDPANCEFQYRRAR